MKRYRLFLFVMAALAALPCAASAVVAYPGNAEVVDGLSGQMLQIRSYGDEFFSYTTDTDGNLLIKDSNGAFRFVVDRNGAFAMGGYVTGGAFARSAASQAQKVNLSGGVSGWKEKLGRLRGAGGRESNGPAARSSSYTPGRITAAYDFTKDPLNGKLIPMTDADHPQPPPMGGTCPLLVLRVEFEDVQSAFVDTDWESGLFKKISEYYTAESNGRFTYVPARETGNIADDGVITVRLPIIRPRYALPTGGNQNSGTGVYAGIYNGQGVAAGTTYAIYNDSALFSYGVDAAANFVDFQQYDRNSDGYISPTELAVLVIVAGYEAAFAGDEASNGLPAVWAHSWQLNNLAKEPSLSPSYLSVLVDGVKLYKYTMMGENLNFRYSYENPQPGVHPIQATHGTACHELGHDMGLKDLYNTGFSNLLQNVDALSLMAAGAWGFQAGETAGSCPTSLDPHSKSFLGFCGETTVSASGAYPLHQSASPDKYGILRVNTASPDVYYLLENRQRAGHDGGLYMTFRDEPGGVVIWRVDDRAVRTYWDTNRLNTVEGNYAIMPVSVENAIGMRSPFRSSVTMSPGEAFLAQRSPLISIASHDAPASMMRIQINLGEPPKPTVPVAVSPPATGDGSTPHAWLLLMALSGALIIALRRRMARG